VLVMMGGGWLLVHTMSEDAKIQDCVQAGRKNCSRLDPATGR